MKTKLLSALAALLLTSSAMANIQHLPFDKNHRFGFTATEFTRNDSIPKDFKNIDFSSEVEIAYIANKNVYFTAGAFVFDDDHYAVSPLVGIKTQLSKSVAPYAEASATLNLKGNHIYRRVFNYDAGVNLYLLDSGYIYAQAGNFGESDEFNYEAGVGFKVGESVVLGASYNQLIKGHFNTVKLSVTYLA